MRNAYSLPNQRYVYIPAGRHSCATIFRFPHPRQVRSGVLLQQDDMAPIDDGQEITSQDSTEIIEPPPSEQADIGQVTKSSGDKRISSVLRDTQEENGCLVQHQCPDTNQRSSKGHENSLVYSSERIEADSLPSADFTHKTFYTRANGEIMALVIKLAGDNFLEISREHFSI